MGGEGLSVARMVSRNEPLARVLRSGRKDEPPLPRPEGWVAPATLGKRTLQTLTLLTREAESFDENDLLLKRCLDAAHAAAFQLEQTERVINNITRNNPSRQAELRGIRSALVQARREFIQSSADILLQGVADASGFLKSEEFAELAAAKGELDAYKTKLERIRLAVDTMRADDPAQYDALISDLTDVAKELTEELASEAKGPTARVLKPLVRSINFAEKAKNLYETGSSLYALAQSMDRLDELGDRIDQENALLRDKLLPLQRQQADLLNARLKCPALAVLSSAP